MVMVADNPVTSVVPVPRLWPGSTVVCLGTGPSLDPDDVAYCRDRAHVLAIKDAVHLAPWADALYSADERWWQHVGPSLSYTGPRFGVVDIQPQWIALLKDLHVHRLLIGGANGLDANPTKVRTGNTSGYSAINLACHLGAAKIVLLGYDMRPAPDGRQNFVETTAYTKKKPPYQWLEVFASLVEPLTAAGVAILNASRETALPYFPRVSLAEALS